MYALVENNEVKQIITNPKPLLIGDVRYPAKIFELWSQDELNAIGIYEVVTDSSNKKDEEYYFNTNPLGLVNIFVIDPDSTNAYIILL